ncbi:MAG: undecaprenyl-diphosphate phosphatase [Candidatus Dojkabacteria bacterium]
MLIAILLGVIQGLTEFLPISSSGHVILLGKLTNYHNEGIVEAVNLGTFLAVLIYYRKDILQIIKSVIPSTSAEQNFLKDKALVPKFIASVIPIGIVGVLIKNVYEVSFETWEYSLLLIGIMSLVFGTLFYIGSRTSTPARSKSTISWLDTLLLSLAQIFAVLPGVSRSGVTLTTTFFSNINREIAAKFVFLMSLPATGLAALNALVINREVALNMELLLAEIFSFAAGILSIHIMVSWLKRDNLLWIWLYRLVFGFVCIGVFFIK